MYTGRVWGTLPRNIIFLRLSETAYGAFSGTVSQVFIKRFRKKLFSTDVVATGIERLIVAISKGRRDVIKGGQVPLHPTPK